MNYELKPNRVIAEMEQREQELQDLLRQCKESLENAPEGMLRIHRDGKRIQYYHRIKGEAVTEKYIRKSEKQLANMLAQKDYDCRLEKMIKKELESIRLLKTQYHAGNYEEIPSILNEIRQELIINRLQTEEEYIKEWEQQPYEKLGFELNDETAFYTAEKERVRSKSEVIIADALNRYKVPYRYEAPIYLNKEGKKVYPDFTCLNVRERKEIIWEHLGMMGKENYADKNVKKLEKYALNGYNLGNNLVITMETMSIPLSTKMIENVIQTYLL